MGVSPVISMLTKKYAHLLGEFEVAERAVEDAHGLDAIIEATNQVDKRKQEINNILAAIETVIELFDPDWDPARVRPNYPRKSTKPGTFSRIAYAVLRDAAVPMTSREIARVVASRLGHEKLEEREINRIDLAIYNTFSGRVGTTVKIVSQNPIRWTMIERSKALPRAKQRRSIKSYLEETAAPELPAARRRAS
jgi:hypothetical protein